MRFRACVEEEAFGQKDIQGVGRGEKKDKGVIPWQTLL